MNDVAEITVAPETAKETGSLPSTSGRPEKKDQEQF
jgi:hypothetical protein